MHIPALVQRPVPHLLCSCPPAVVRRRRICRVQCREQSSRAGCCRQLPTVVHVREQSSVRARHASITWGACNHKSHALRPSARLT